MVRRLTKTPSDTGGLGELGRDPDPVQISPPQTESIPNRDAQTVKIAVEIACSPEAAFAYVSDVRSHPEWSIDDIRVLTAPPPPIGVGSRYVTVGHSVVQGRDQRAEVEITIFDPPRRFGFIARSGPRDFEHVFTFEQVDGSVRVERAMTFVPYAYLSARMKGSSKRAAQHSQTSMHLLKRHLENATSTASNGAPLISTNGSRSMSSA